MKNLSCPWIGFFAREVTTRNTIAVVSGTTKRGLFLRPGDDLILYLSEEKYRGPLTINLNPTSSLEKPIKPGSQVKLTPDALLLSDKLIISLADTEIWNSPQPPNDQTFSLSKWDDLYLQTQNQLRDQEYFGLLKLSFGVDDFKELTLSPVENRIAEILYPASKNLSSSIKRLNDLSGLGPGLTPLGDDFILGCTLAINRTKTSSNSASRLSQINQGLIDVARSRTNQISLSLLISACQGAADERLLVVLDRIISQAVIKSQELQNLLTWGSSSGISALAGMIFGLKTAVPEIATAAGD
jgi:hypothetical protein